MRTYKKIGKIFVCERARRTLGSCIECSGSGCREIPKTGDRNVISEYERNLEYVNWRVCGQDLEHWQEEQKQKV